MKSVILDNQVNPELFHQSRMDGRVCRDPSSEPKEKHVWEGMVFDLQRFSVHDGPGIRTTVFLKGCPLRCWWCHNPESWNIQPEILYCQSHCIGCQKCLVSCPQKALYRLNSKIRLYRSRCDLCGECVEVCSSKALVWVGKKMSVDQVMNQVLRDKIYYKNSGGGVTISGGEPTSQPDFVLEVLKECRQNNLHTALDTCGFCQEADMDRILEYVDLVLFDLKETDDQRHRELTGVSNALIIKNLENILKRKKNLVIRIPVVPGINDREENFRGISDLLVKLPPVAKVELLPYHQFTLAKYENLGIAAKIKNLPTLDLNDLERKAKMFFENNFPVEILGKEQRLDLNPESSIGEKIYEKRPA